MYHSTTTTDEREVADLLPLVAMVNHELNTPLTVIRGYTQLLQRRMQTTSSSYEASIATYDAANLDIVLKLEEQVNRMIGLVHDLLDASLFEKGYVTLHMTAAINVRSVLERVIEQCQILAPTRPIILDISRNLRVTADMGRLEQVMLNLVTNALKYSGGDLPVRIGARLSTSPTTHNHDVLLWVKDQGRGIAHDEQAYIFDPFFRVRNTQARPISGHGLGLYICQQIVAAHRGRIWVESTPGVGSTFYVALPATM